MRVVYQTNLDDAQRYLNQLQNENFIPKKGDRIEFDLYNGKVFELEVVSITYKRYSGSHCYHCVVELHVPSTYKTMSLKWWLDWFDNHRR